MEYTGWKRKLAQFILAVVNKVYEERFSDLERRLLTLEENVRNNNDQISILKTDQDTMEDFRDRLTRIEENIRGNNVAISKLESEGSLSIWNAKLESMKNSIRRLQESFHGEVHYQKKGEIMAGSLSEESHEGTYCQMDYFAFENYFRGNESVIKQRQEIYLPFFEGCSKVFDLGCGRGEFLELLREKNIDAVGVDSYDEFSVYCKNKGLNVITGDAISVLSNFPDKAGGVFAGQLVEHLTLEQIITLCEQAYEKLEEGGYFIMETPNPMSLAIYTHAFYMDPSHQKPVHPLTLKYLTEKAGFKDVQILFTEGSKLKDEAIPELKGDSISNLEEFNSSMQKVSEYLFGSQDYAIVAKR